MRAALAIAAAVALPLSATGTAMAQAVDRNRPHTVPALREWRAAPGTWRLRPDARIVVRHPHRRALLGEARQLAGDLGALLGRRVAVTTARSAWARPGDVVLIRVRDPALGDEGYALHVQRAFTIAARAPAGTFYGGRTLLQLLRGRQPIPRGQGRDVPRYRERALMIDNGRAFFSAAWLQARIRELAALKLNRLHLHFSDNQGFRLQSDTHPEVPTPPFLTKRDLRAILETARRHHVTVVPELDMPGHMQAALRAHPELQLTNRFGERQPDKLDVTNPAARRFAAELLGEYLPLFPGPVWHTGADEYLGIAATPADYELYPQLESYADARYGAQANGKDAVLDFINFVGERVRAAGKALRAWSDGAGGGAATRLDPRTSLMWWEDTHSPPPAGFIAAGHEVLNASWWPLYYVTGGPVERARTPVEDMYEHWEPWVFEGYSTPRWASPGSPPKHALAPGEPRQLGASLQVWNDDPSAPGAREQAVAEGIAPRLRVLAQKAWGSPPLTESYAQFAAIAGRVAPSTE